MQVERSLPQRFDLKSDEAARDRGNREEDGVGGHDGLRKGHALHAEDQGHQDKGEDAVQQGPDDDVLIHDRYLLWYCDESHCVVSFLRVHDTTGIVTEPSHSTGRKTQPHLTGGLCAGRPMRP